MTTTDRPIWQRLVAADRGDGDPQARMAHTLRDPRIRSIAWKDLVAYRPHEVALELTIVLPWLALSLAAAAYDVLPVALVASFMVFLTGLRQVHNGHHHALGIGRLGNELFLFAMSVVMLGAMHAVKFNHLRHHRHCMGAEDVEALSVRRSGIGAVLIGPYFPLLLHWTALRLGNRTVRRWIAAELIANLAWIAAVFLWWDVACLRYHVLAMAAGQCLTAFFAVWTVHNHTGDAEIPARSLRGRWLNLLSYHMFLHAEHHLFPKVPTRRLPELARRLDAAIGPTALRGVV